MEGYASVYQVYAVSRATSEERAEFCGGAGVRDGGGEGDKLELHGMDG